MFDDNGKWHTFGKAVCHQASFFSVLGFCSTTTSKGDNRSSNSLIHRIKFFASKTCRLMTSYWLTLALHPSDISAFISCGLSQ